MSFIVAETQWPYTRWHNMASADCCDFGHQRDVPPFQAFSCDGAIPPFFFLKLVRMWLSAELGDVTLAAAYLAADVAEELGQVSPRSARLWSGLR